MTRVLINITSKAQQGGSTFEQPRSVTGLTYVCGTGEYGREVILANREFVELKAEKDDLIVLANT